MMKNELIGHEIKVTENNNKTCIGMMGKIINETKNTLTIRIKNKGTKQLIKDQITFKINNQIIKGKNITFRPEDRTKRK